MKSCTAAYNSFAATICYKTIEINQRMKQIEPQGLVTLTSHIPKDQTHYNKDFLIFLKID